MVKTRRWNRQPDGPPAEEEARRGVPRPAHGRRSHQRRRGRACAGLPSNPSQEGRRQAVPAPPPARQALSALPARPDQSQRRLPGQQQPHLRRAFAAGRTERRRPRPRRLPEAGQWFEDRWDDRWCIDISKELVEIIEESWAREELSPPYHIYLKMAYHLSQEARAGLTEFRIPRDFGNMLFDFQVAAVKIAAHHLNKRGGVLIGDVVGLGKTLMATAVATNLRGRPRSRNPDYLPEEPGPDVGRLPDAVSAPRPRCFRSAGSSRNCPNLRRYRLVLIDESHNLRNREGKRYRAIQDYIQREREQGASCCPRRPTTRPISTCPTSFGSSSPRTRTLESGPRTSARTRRDRVHPPPPVLRPLPGGLREERVSPTTGAS